MERASKDSEARQVGQSDGHESLINLSSFFSLGIFILICMPNHGKCSLVGGGFNSKIPFGNDLLEMARGQSVAADTYTPSICFPN